MIINAKQIVRAFQVCVSVTLLSGNGMAGTMGDIESPSWMKKLYIGVDGGYSMSLNSTNFTPYNGADVAVSGQIVSVPENTTFQRDISDSGMIGVLLGYRVDDSLNFNLNYDYRGGFSWQVPTNGLVTSGVNDLIYFVKNITIQTLFVNFVITPNKNTEFWGKWTPYVSGGLGASFNQVGLLRSVELIDQDVYNNISGASVTNFAWNAGVGIDYALGKNLSYTLGYRLVDAGTIQTSNTLVNAIGEFTINSFKADHVLLNEIVTGLTWQFDV